MEKIDEKIFDFIYTIAMRDATLRGAYTGERRHLPDSTPDARSLLKKHVDEVLNGSYNDSSQEKYDEDFLTLAKEICIRINNNGGHFHFGNAQKLINMTLKYFYVMRYKNTDYGERFKYCHCPMDKKLLSYIWDTSTINGFTKTRFTDSWGNEDFEKGNCMPERYKAFQEAVMKRTKEMGMQNRLEYDYYVWNQIIEESEEND